MKDKLIASLARTPDLVRSLVADVCETSLSHKPAPDVFSLRENVMHVRDIDIEGYEKRIVLILSEVRPTLPDVDGARLAIERDYNNQPLAAALEAFANSRSRSIARLRQITDADLDRTAEFEGV